MVRVFVWLAIGNLGVLVAVFVLGITSDAAAVERHIALAVFALLLSCLIQVVVFTYFTVTGKMIAQAVHLGGLGFEPVTLSKERKRRITRLMAALIGAVVVLTATGALHWRGDHSGPWHLATAMLAIGIHVYVYFGEFGLIAENAASLERTMSMYNAAKHAPQDGPRAKGSL